MSTDHTLRNDPKLVIFASSLGTVFEWYDFFLYAALAAFFGAQFFPKGDETAAILSNLAILGAGFAARPFGAVLFGHVGDVVGRKHAFLVTITIMGLATTLVGLLPTYDQVGIWAPVLLVSLRLLQGLALGGEYGGAAIYVAEHAPNNKRGAYTGWIQITAGLGFFLSLIVILGCRQVVGEDAFKAWGWRLPFLLSFILLVMSVMVRMKLHESPIFLAMKAEGKASTAPLRDTMRAPGNLWRMLTAMLGANAGQGVLWYTSQIYVLYFLVNQMKVPGLAANILMCVVVVATTPLFALFGALSDKVGRKPIMVAGMLMGAVAILPAYHSIAQAANPALMAAAKAAPVVITGGDCTIRIFAQEQTTPCARTKAFLTKSGVSYTHVQQDVPNGVEVQVGDDILTGFDDVALKSVLSKNGYPEGANPSQHDYVVMGLWIAFLAVFATMTYGPIAAFLVELFPCRIRYSSLSIPYHLGSGVIGGFTPFVAFAIMTATGQVFAGLWYPIVVAALSAIINITCLPETKDRSLHD
jgi:MFS family permease